MKIKVGRSANSLQIFNDEGVDVASDFRVKTLHLRLEPDEPTTVLLELHVDEIEIEPSEILSTRRTS